MGETSLIGAVIGQYRLEEKLGVGAVGDLYRAVHVESGGVAALKLTHQLDDATGEKAARIRREMEALRGLESPSIPALLDYGIAPGGGFYLVRQLVVGQSLEALLEGRRALPEREALLVALSIAGALAAAHRRDIIHRDLKPSNVIVPVPSGGVPQYAHAQLTDFGAFGSLLRDSAGGGARATMAGQIFGTPTYMAPEQVTAQPQSPETDVYGLGLLLFEMCYGRRPFPETANFVELLSQIISKAVEFPSQPAVRPATAAFIARCLSKAPAERPRDGQAAEWALRGLLRELPDGCRRCGTVNAPASKFCLGCGAPLEEAGAGVPWAGAGPSASPTAPASYGPPAPVAASAATATASPSPLTTTGEWVVPAPPASAPAPRGVPRVLSIAGAVVVVAALGVVSWKFDAWGAALGIPLSVAAGFGLHALIERRRPPLQGDLGLLLARSASATDLRRSIAIDLEQLVSACREVDHTIMAKTIGMLVHEYDRAKKSSDRQEALVRAVTLMEKLVEKLEPWYVRHQKAMTWGVSVVGSLAGIGKTLLDIIGRSELHH